MLFIENLPALEVEMNSHNCGLGKFLYGQEGATLESSNPELARLLENLKKTA